MKNLLESIKAINDSCSDVALMFSCGRDSTVMLDLFVKYARQSIGRVVFMYFCPDLSYDEKILQYYEHRHDLGIDRVAHPDTAYLVNTREKKSRVGMSHFEKGLRADGAAWIAYGFRKDESLQRRGQLSMADNGIDYKYRKVFPIAEWAERHAKAYVVQHRLPLPPEYKMGMRDLNSFKGEALLHIYNNYRADYERIVDMYPDTRGELMRALEK